MKKIWRKLITVIIVIMATAILGGCQEKPKQETKGGTESTFPMTIEDVYGTKVTIEKEPQRIVAMAPSTVEILYKLGLEDKIVGVTEYCDFPEEAKNKPKVGDFNGVNLEKIIEAKPDIVFAGAGMSKEVYQKLVDLKINVVVAEAKTLQQIPETFAMIGKSTGTADKAKVLADEVNAKIDGIKDKVKDSLRVKTYYVISFGKAGNWTAGKGTFISDLITMAGGENVADDVEGWKEYSIEKIVEKNPDIILLSGMVANSNKDTLDDEKGYKETSAVKNNKVLILDDNLLERPGPRIADGLEVIAKAIHPEVFK